MQTNLGPVKALQFLSALIGVCFTQVNVMILDIGGGSSLLNDLFCEPKQFSVGFTAKCQYLHK